jgi:hypothetical protein
VTTDVTTIVHVVRGRFEIQVWTNEHVYPSHPYRFSFAVDGVWYTSAGVQNKCETIRYARIRALMWCRRVARENALSASRVHPQLGTR